MLTTFNPYLLSWPQQLSNAGQGVLSWGWAAVSVFWVKNLLLPETWVWGRNITLSYRAAIRDMCSTVGKKKKKSKKQSWPNPPRVSFEKGAACSSWDKNHFCLRIERYITRFHLTPSPLRRLNSYFDLECRLIKRWSVIPSKCPWTRREHRGARNSVALCGRACEKQCTEFLSLRIIPLF